MKTRLSKSRFQRGLQCERALWLSVHEPALAAPVTESTQWVFDQGHEVGVLAQRLFPCGIEVAEGPRETEQALATTARLIADGATVLYEPAFTHDDVLVRVDILVWVGDGMWDLYEVKSGGRVKPENITDAAVQRYVLIGAGIPVRRTHIVHLDTSYVWEGGDYDVERLFTIEDVTGAVMRIAPGIPAEVARLRAVLAGAEPEVRPGDRCRKPYGCDFAEHCHGFLPQRHPVTALPRLSERAFHALLDLGVTSIRDIPEEFELLTPAQAGVVRAVKSGEPWVDADGLARALSRLEWPVRHLDFETVNPALPLWPGTRPYQAIPFQYSVHTHHEDGSLEHREYLHPGTGDPRRTLVAHLVEDLGSAGSIMHYSSFERTRIAELARDLPGLAGPLEAITDRLVDLEPIVRRHTLHPHTNGRTSIKHVLPAWCPDLSYEGLEIGDGTTASVRYLRGVRGELTPGERAELHAHLREYCKLDTLAMARLLDMLLQQAGE